MTVRVPCRCHLQDAWRVQLLSIPSLTAGAPHVWPHARRRDGGRVPSWLRASAGAVRRVEGRHTRTERQVRDGHALATTAGIDVFPLEAGSRAAGETNIAIAPPSHESQHGTERCLWMVPSSKRAGEDHTEIACFPGK